MKLFYLTFRLRVFLLICMPVFLRSFRVACTTFATLQSGPPLSAPSFLPSLLYCTLPHSPVLPYPHIPSPCCCHLPSITLPPLPAVEVPLVSLSQGRDEPAFPPRRCSDNITAHPYLGRWREHREEGRQGGRESMGAEEEGK